MKAKQSGGPASLVHRCFVAYADRLMVSAFAVAVSALGLPSVVLAETDRSLDDFAQVYVDQFFEPEQSLKLSDDAKRKSKALAHYALGRGFEARGRAEDAIEAYAEVLRNQPDQFFLARKTAYLMARSGRQEEGLRLLEESLEGNPDQPFAHIGLSEFLATYQSNDPAGLRRSFEVIEGAVERFPEEAAVYEHLVKLYLSADRRDEARAAVSKAAARDEVADPIFWLRLGRIAGRVWPVREGGDANDADLVNGIYAKALDRAEGRPEVVEQIGDYYHATGQFDRAISAYGGLIDSQPDRLDLREKLARVYGAKGDEERVIQTLKEMVEIDPQNAEVHKQIAGIFLRAERYKEAIPHLKTALSITKGNIAEYRALAEMMINSNEDEAAVAFLEDAAYLFADAPDFPFLLTFSLARLERWEESVKQFEKTLELAKDAHPQLLNEQFYFRYAAAHERNGDIEKAEGLFRKSIELIAKNDPDDANQDFTATVYNYLGYMWLENDMNLDEAGELIKTAAELSPESGAIADSLGWYYFKRGRFEEAREDLLRAESLIEEEDAVIYDHIGQVFYQLGDTEKAIEYLEKAVAMEPANEEYAARLQRIREGTEEKFEPASTSPKAGSAASE